MSLLESGKQRCLKATSNDIIIEKDYELQILWDEIVRTCMERVTCQTEQFHLGHWCRRGWVDRYVTMKPWCDSVQRLNYYLQFCGRHFALTFGLWVTEWWVEEIRFIVRFRTSSKNWCQKEIWFIVAVQWTWCTWVRARACVCVCVCVWEREKQTDRQTDRQTEARDEGEQDEYISGIQSISRENKSMLFVYYTSVVHSRIKVHYNICAQSSPSYVHDGTAADLCGNMDLLWTVVCRSLREYVSITLLTDRLYTGQVTLKLGL